jgi:hypothetical protein
MGERGQSGNPPKQATTTASFNESIDFIIGAPPVGVRGTGDEVGPGPYDQRLINNAMPIVHIQPGIPDFERGIDLMRRQPAFSKGTESAYSEESLKKIDTRKSYLDLLRELGFNLKQPSPSISNHLTCAFLADSFPTDTFTNEYGENWLQKITNVGAEGLHGVAQMLGARSFTGMIESATKKAAGIGEEVGGLGGTIIGGAADVAGFGINQLNKLVEALPEQSGLRRLAQNVNVLAAGGRIDFPMLWKNSVYQPSYTMTIRLYNPNPNSKSSTAKYIIGPVAALLLLGLPQSIGEGVYSWPFIHRFHAPGIYTLDPGYIASMTVVKGGDQQQIAWNQRMGVVDVRIDFGSVFNSILSAASASRDRPTLKGYLDAMAAEKNGVVGVTDTFQTNNQQDQSPSVLQITKNLAANSGGLTNDQIREYQKNLSTQRADIATTQSKTQLDITEVGETIQARVTKDIKDIASNLEDLIPNGIKISF